MTLETYNQATQILSRIERLKSEQRQLQQMIDEARGDDVKVRIKGLTFTLPKRTLRTEVQGKRAALNSELQALQAQFNAL